MSAVRHRGWGRVGARGGARRRAWGRRARGAGPRGRGGEARTGGARRAKGPAVLASHVFGLGIDEVLTSTRDLDPTPADGTADSQVWLHQDDMGTVYAATGAGGIVVERYDYGDYGLPTILDPDGVTVRDESAIGNRFLFTGREWLASLELYDYRHRMMDPRTGRFTERDPLEYVDGLNLYAYALESPHVFIDPQGLNVMLPELGCSGGTPSDDDSYRQRMKNKDLCEALREKLRNLREQMEKRLREHSEDKEGLDEKHTPGRDFKDTREGHRMIIRALQMRIRAVEALVKVWCDNKVPPPPGVRVTSPKDIPNMLPKMRPEDFPDRAPYRPGPFDSIPTLDPEVPNRLLPGIGTGGCLCIVFKECQRRQSVPNAVP